jgi:shikimate kinase
MIQRGQPSVVALGGGTFVQPGNIDLVESNGITVWLDCPLETVRRRVAEPSSRPLARDAQRFEELFHERHAGYGRADYRIPIDSDDPLAAVEAVLKLPLFE